MFRLFPLAGGNSDLLFLYGYPIDFITDGYCVSLCDFLGDERLWRRMRQRNGWMVLAVALTLVILTGCDRVWKSDRYTSKGMSLLEQHQYQEAETAFKEAIRIRRENGSAHYYLALLYLATDRYGKAVSLMRFYIEYADRTRAWMGPQDDEFLAKIKALYTQQTGEIPVRGVSE